ncbi:MAG: STAS domain-containing protein [Merismopedia sp. SIO2A8]|nr:STAS domain-containing protein [Symploca sp. SIO2B6]NET47627.1 STAS domain-containing protein [Merismopedia sp. SIO2A8]
MSTQILKIYQPATHLLSAADSDDLKGWVHASLQQGVHTLLLDLRNVLFMDSRGLALLLVAHKQAKKMGATLALCGVQEQVLMVLKLSNLHQLFPMYSSPEDYQTSVAS